MTNSPARAAVLGTRPARHRSRHSDRLGLVLAAIGVLALAGCALFEEDEARGGETERYLIDEVPGLEREPEGPNGSGVLTEDRLRKLGFSRDQASLFDDSEAIGFVRVWLNEDASSYLWTLVFQHPSESAATEFIAAFVGDAVVKGGTPLVIPGFESAAAYRFEVTGGFNLTMFQRGDLAFAIAGNDTVANLEALAQLGQTQTAHDPDAPGADDDEGSSGRLLVAVVAAALAAGVAFFAVQVRRRYEF
ncbi:hypothetical protein BH18ACT4_BH18ACT4_05570 [soil metagenome]